MRVAVTGAAGFLGRHLVQRLAERGDRAVAIDLAFDPPLQGAEGHIASVTDGSAMAKALAGCDALIHAAAITDLWHPHPSVFDRVNHLGTEIALAAAAEAGVGKAVLVSSYVTRLTGRRRDPPRIVAESPVPSLSEMAGPYPRSKWLAERVAEAAALPVATVLPSAPLGPGDRRPTPPGALIRDLALGRLPAMLDCTWTFVDIRDLADATLAALDRGAPGRAWLIGNPTIDTEAFLEAFAAGSGRTVPHRRLPWGAARAAASVEETLASLVGRPPRATVTGVALAGPRLHVDSGRAAAELGFRPRALSKTLEDALRWMAAEGMVPAHALATKA